METARFLANKEPMSEGTATWGNDIRLHILGYISDHVPPLELVSSVRALVFRDDTVLVVRDRVGHHIVPGGRREAGESLEETLRREVLEETRWKVGDLTLLGFLHFHHLLPKPQDYSYPYPDFFQVIYMAEAQEFIAEAELLDDYVLESTFRPIDEVEGLKLDSGERMYLRAALAKQRRKH